MSTDLNAVGAGSSRARADRPRLGGSIANFAQRLGASTDVARAAMVDHDHMPSERPIVDLADRHADGLDIVLVWARQTDRLWVTVTHRRSGQTARIDASPANALDVFRHPFAYGALAQ